MVNLGNNFGSVGRLIRSDRWKERMEYKSVRWGGCVSGKRSDGVVTQYHHAIIVVAKYKYFFWHAKSHGHLSRCRTRSGAAHPLSLPYLFFFPTQHNWHRSSHPVPPSPREDYITSVPLRHSVSLLLSLVVAFKVTNMFTRTYSNPRASARVWVSEGCESTVYTRYFYRQPRLSGGQRPEK